jgi:hypothetical protein
MFDVPAQTVPTATLLSEAGTGIELLPKSNDLYRPGDEVELELKLRTITETDQTDRRLLLTPQEPQGKVAVPASDTTATIEVTLVGLDERESPELEIRLLAKAKVLPQQPLPSPTQSWNPVAGKSVSQPLALSEESIEDHRQQTHQQINQLSALLRKNFGAKQFKLWAAESAEARKAAVDDYARLAIQAIAGQERIRRGYSVPADLKEVNEQLQALVEEHPNLPQLFMACGLQNPLHCELARCYNHLADSIEEVDLWADAMQQFLQHLTDKGRLDYRLYVTVDEREIDLVVTEGFHSVD